MKTESKISIETRTVSVDDTLYIIKTKKGQFEVMCKGDGTLLVTASAPLMNSAVGGRGEDDKKDAWFTDEHCKTNSEAVSNVLELFMAISKK